MSDELRTFEEMAYDYKDILESRLANKDLKAKKIAKKKAKLKAKKKCKGNMTPSVKVQGTNVKVTCTPIDKTRSRKAKKTARKMKSNRAAMRRKTRKASATKKWRS
jgi:hypothetical protein